MGHGWSGTPYWSGTRDTDTDKRDTSRIIPDRDTDTWDTMVHYWGFIRHRTQFDTNIWGSYRRSMINEGLLPSVLPHLDILNIEIGKSFFSLKINIFLMFILR